MILLIFGSVADTIINYLADIKSVSDVSPFGAPLKDRTWSAGSYRYGMNGQEKDDEIAQGIYTAMYWEYDSRLGRRWNLDPKKAFCVPTKALLRAARRQ